MIHLHGLLLGVLTVLKVHMRQAMVSPLINALNAAQEHIKILTVVPVARTVQQENTSLCLAKMNASNVRRVVTVILQIRQMEVSPHVLLEHSMISLVNTITHHAKNVHQEHTVQNMGQAVVSRVCLAFLEHLTIKPDKLVVQLVKREHSRIKKDKFHATVALLVILLIYQAQRNVRIVHIDYPACREAAHAPFALKAFTSMTYRLR
mmetsp:Transcript_9434/g.14053  ORF Transcript_9434/g.14053 Transcript_9434/m.14053 type:complete len:206 (+) Transcript_9434:3-620(+)